jgi:hypothetical protein
MIYLKLRQAGMVVNHKRVDRLYAEAGLQVRSASGRRSRCRTVTRWNALGRQSGLVDGFRVRPDGRRASHQEPDHCR